MNTNAFNKIVSAVIDVAPYITDSRKLTKITVDEKYHKPKYVNTIYDCTYCCTTLTDDIIIANGIEMIIILAVKRENGHCVGYEYMYSVDTKNKTQIEITAELMYKVIKISQ